MKPSETNAISVVFPDERVVDFRPVHPVVMLGANGTGKSWLGAQLANLNPGRNATSSASVVRLVKTRSKNGKRPIETKTDLSDGAVAQIQQIWNELFPDRRIDVSHRVRQAPGDQQESSYVLSDGEQVILDRLVQTIGASSSSLVIVDGPELHVQKVLLTRLWDALEDVRADCAFLYITHDLDFAASRRVDHILWVKDYDRRLGCSFDYLDLRSLNDLPVALLMEIIGAGGKVLFVEGNRGSPDYRLYREIFRDAGYQVIPVGGCQDVVAMVRAKNRHAVLNGIDAVGLIDRDRRTQDDLDALKDQGVYALEVAEVENLFVVPDLLRFMADRLGCPEGSYDRLIQLIRNQYVATRARQISDAFRQDVIDEIKTISHKLKTPTPEAVLLKMRETFNEPHLRDLVRAREDAFPETQDIDTILRLLNDKSLVKRVGEALDVKGPAYQDKVINLLRRKEGTARAEIIAALRPYVPKLP